MKILALTLCLFGAAGMADAQESTDDPAALQLPDRIDSCLIGVRTSGMPDTGTTARR